MSPTSGREYRRLLRLSKTKAEKREQKMTTTSLLTVIPTAKGRTQSECGLPEPIVYELNNYRTGPFFVARLWNGFIYWLCSEGSAYVPAYYKVDAITSMVNAQMGSISKCASRKNVLVYRRLLRANRAWVYLFGSNIEMEFKWKRQNLKYCKTRMLLENLPCRIGNQ